MTPEEFIQKAETAAIKLTLAQRAAESAKDFMQSRLETGWDYKEDKAKEQARDAISALLNAHNDLTLLAKAQIDYT